MKTRILVVAVLSLVAGSIAQAQEPQLQGWVDLTYSSKYVWRGFDIFADKSATHLGVDLNYDGFGIDIMGHRANAGGFENAERWDFNPFYAGGLFMDQPCAVQYRLGWVYYNYPDNKATDFDIQEAHAIVAMPKLLPQGIVPSYALVKLWPSSSGSLVGARSPFGGTASGWAHIFMLDYALSVNGILPETPEQVFNFHAEAVYNDGVGPGGQRVDHDWSNAVFGVSTDVDLGENLAFTPGVYHQVTMDTSVNDDKDETWVSLGLRYSF